MFDKIKGIADERLEKITEQLILLDQIENFPKFVYTEFKDVMKEPYSFIMNLVNSKENRLSSHDIQKWFMKISNKYLQEWLHINYPYYKNKVFVSDSNYSTFPSRFRINYQVSEYKNDIHNGQVQICRFDIYEQTYLNALRYKTIDQYDKSVENEMIYLNRNLSEAKEKLDKWLGYKNNPKSLIKGTRDAFIYIKDKKKITSNIDELVNKYENNFKYAEKNLTDFDKQSKIRRENFLKSYEVIKVVDGFFKELSYKLIESDNYY